MEINFLTVKCYKLVLQLHNLNKYSALLIVQLFTSYILHSTFYKILQETLLKYVPENAVNQCIKLIKDNFVHLKIVNERQTKHGDYRKAMSGKHEISVNGSLNKYRFLMTLIHEIAHLMAFEKFGRDIKPHGVEWKMTFQRIMLPFLRPDVYPNDLLPLLARHFRNPSASRYRCYSISCTETI